MVNSHEPMGVCHDAGSYILNQNQKEGGRLAETLYFAYGSNMNLDQMRWQMTEFALQMQIRGILFSPSMIE